MFLFAIQTRCFCNYAVIWSIKYILVNTSKTTAKVYYPLLKVKLKVGHLHFLYLYIIYNERIN